MWWWFEFRFRTVEVWTFQLFLFVLAYGFIIYLTCAWLFPAQAEEHGGYKNYFYARRAWFFGLLAAYLLIDLVDTFLKGPAHFMSFGLEYPVATVSFTILSARGWRDPKRVLSRRLRDCLLSLSVRVDVPLCAHFELSA